MLEMAWAALATTCQSNKGRFALADVTIATPLVLSVHRTSQLMTTVNYSTGLVEFLSDAAHGNNSHMSATSGGVTNGMYCIQEVETKTC